MSSFSQVSAFSFATCGVRLTDLRFTDERDPGFWQDLKALGYSFAEYTTEEQEGWWAIVLDACIQSMASGFVGTAHSTVSLISERRVQEWSGGPTRMVKWGKLGADDH